MDFKGVLLQWFINVLIKKTSVTRVNKFSNNGIKNENMSDQQLAVELHKLIIRKFKKRKLHSPFTNYICGVGLADMQLISKFNKGIRFLLCVIDIFSK